MAISPARLREMRTLLDAAPIRYAETAAEACEQAADEIERLQSEIRELAAHHNSHCTCPAIF